MILMYDSVDVSTVPGNAEAVAGYVGGFWPTYEGLVSRFPHAHALSIAINAHEHARCLDVENGDASPGEAPGWLRDYALQNPVLYCSASVVSEVTGACSRAGIVRERYLIWSAHYGAGRHICGPGTCGYPRADGTQYADPGPYDVSLVSDSFFPVYDPLNYARYSPGPFQFGNRWVNERATVQEFDRLIAHPKQNRRRISVLRDDMRLLRGRLWTVAHRDHPPSWSLYYRGWRLQKLQERIHGTVTP